MFRANCSFMWTVGLALSITGFCSGCAHMIENRAILAFANGLEKQDLQRLKDSTSVEFSKRALRAESSLEDLKHLNLPDGKSKIAEVDEISKDRKKVTVHVGEQKKELFYELVRDDSGKWVVDNIYMKQKKKGLEVYKSVTEQMDLLLTVREFIDTWTNGDRELVLSVTTPKFRKTLSELPPSFLAQMTRQVTSGKPKGGLHQPVASMDDKVAVVRLPRKNGETVLTMESRKGTWQVADVAIASKDEEQKLPSAMNLAKAVNRCIAFLSAYNDENKDKLAEVCVPDFFSGSLSFADLSQVRLPDSVLSEHELQVKLRGPRADFVLRNESEFVQIDMQRQQDESDTSAGEYVVSDVTIYEISTKQEKRLSALFTAQSVLEVFVDALSKRQLERVKHCSTQDFANRVWSKMSDATVASMPLEQFDAEDVEYSQPTFMGALMKIDVKQGGIPLTYLLRDEGGRFMVDDVQWQRTGVPSSVKSTLEVLIPIQEFASGITLGRDSKLQEQALDLIRSNCSNDFNRLVWSQSDFVPNSGMSADTFLTQAPLRSIVMDDKEIVVQFGDNRYGAKVKLTNEFNRYIVDDVHLIAGVEESERLSMRQVLRNQLAKGEARGPQTIQQASFSEEQPKRKAPTGVTTAVYEEESDVEVSSKVPLEEPRKIPEATDEPFEEEETVDEN